MEFAEGIALMCKLCVLVGAVVCVGAVIHTNKGEKPVEEKDEETS